MKRFLLVALVTVAAPAWAADVGISISLGQPGFYGQIDIVDYPPPRVIYAEPVIVQEAVIVSQPIYLRVEAEHVQHWDQHCSHYGACAQRVYFVEDGWYDEVYVPNYQKRHGNKGDGTKSKKQGKDHRK